LPEFGDFGKRLRPFLAAAPRSSDRGNPWNPWLFSEPNPLLNSQARPFAGGADASSPSSVLEPNAFGAILVDAQKGRKRPESR
jgi:hypothetical protein